jgi:predicted transcriptional regulator
MKHRKLAKLELQVMELLLIQGKASIREIQEAFAAPRPAYTTIQTTVYRLEEKGAVRRVRKIGNADIFQPAIGKDVVRNTILDEVLSWFGGKAQPMMAQLAEAGKITIDDIRDLEELIRSTQKSRSPKRKGKSS